jgi:hypothetical protein
MESLALMVSIIFLLTIIFAVGAMSLIFALVIRFYKNKSKAIPIEPYPTNKPYLYKKIVVTWE